jgi:hypothetical protein
VFSGGYSTVDVSNPFAPKLLQGPDNPAIESGDIALNGSGLGVAVGRDGGGGNGVVAVDVVNTSDPTKTGQFITRYALPSPGLANATEPFGVAIGNRIAFVAAGAAGLQVVNYESFDTKGVPPTVTITQPPPAKVTEGQTVTIGATVSDDVQVRNVEVLLNGSVVTNSVSYPWNLSAQLPTIAANGSNQVTLQVEAIDTGVTPPLRLRSRCSSCPIRPRRNLSAKTLRKAPFAARHRGRSSSTSPRRSIRRR